MPRLSVADLAIHPPHDGTITTDDDFLNRLNAEWNELQHQIQVTMSIAGKDPDATKHDQSRLEKFVDRADQIHQSQAAIEDELFRLWHQDDK
jgi:hypothetical protein